MKISKQKAYELFGAYPECKYRLDRISDDFVYFDLVGRETYKSNKQNRLFHGLLQCFFASGCASFDSFDELRNYYKRIAGLVKKTGSKIIESSWGDASASQARIAIDMMLRDMDMSGVSGSSQSEKYEEILKGINQWYDL